MYNVCTKLTTNDNELTKSFIEYIQFEKRLSSQTVLSYQISLSKFLTFLDKEGGIEPQNATAQIIKSFLLYLSEINNSARTVNHELSALKSFYKFLRIKGVIKSAPTNKVIAPKFSKPLPTFFNEKDFDKLLFLSNNLSTFDERLNFLIVEIIYQTGLRKSELTSLKFSSINLKTREIRVIGKGNKERIIPFGDDLKRKIEEYIKERKETIETNSDYLLINSKGVAINTQYIDRAVKKTMSLVSSQKKITPHQLRHSFATAMMNNDADINAVKELLGHSSLAATQIYTHASFEKLNQVYKQAHPRGEKKE